MTRLLLSLLLFVLTVGTGCGRAPYVEDLEAAPPPQGPRPDSEQWDAVIHLFDRGRTKAVIEAEYLAVFDQPRNSYTHMDTMQVDFFDEGGEAGSHLEADAGEIHDQEREGRRRVKTWGGVVLTGQEGQTVRADTLWWDEAGDRVYTDGPVEVTTIEGELLRGIGFESDTRLENMKIFEGSGVSPRWGEWLDEERRAESETLPDSTAAPADTLRPPARPDTTRIPP